MNGTLKYILSSILIPFLIGGIASFTGVKIGLAELNVKYEYLQRDIDRVDNSAQYAHKRIDQLQVTK